MNWGWPIALQALWVIPLFGLYAWWRIGRRHKLIGRIGSDEALDHIMPGRSKSADILRLFLLLAALCFGILALAQPRWGYEWQKIQRRGLDVMIALDTSRSMLVTDLPGNRFEASVRGIEDFVGLLQGDRLGLVAFAGASFLNCPLTSDYRTFLLTLKDVNIGVIQQGGTDIGGALREAMESFEDDVQSDRVIILITDGEDHEDRMDVVLNEIRERNIKLFSLGVGTAAGKPIEINAGRGETKYLKDQDGQIVTSSLQEAPLRQMAQATGGFYVRSFSQGDFGLETILLKGIEGLERSSNKESRVKVFNERFGWLLGACLVLLLLEGMIRKNSKHKRT